MQVNLQKKALVAALAPLARAVSGASRKTAPGQLRLCAGAGRVWLSASGVGLDMQTVLDAEVITPGELELPCGLFTRVVAALGGGDVSLRHDLGQLSVTAGASHVRMRTGNPGRLPVLQFAARGDLTVDGSALAQAIRRTRHAVLRDRYAGVLCGLAFEIAGKHSRVVASDGLRLAAAGFTASGTGTTVIVPREDADEIARAVTGETAYLVPGEATLGVVTERVRLNVKLTGGTYPDYRRIVPDKAVATLTLSADALRGAVRRTGTVAGVSVGYRLDLHVLNRHLRLSAQGDDGQASETLDVGQVGRKSVTARLDARYLREALTMCGGEVELLLGGETTPTLLRPTERPGDFAIIRPLAKVTTA